jgi:H+-transporting ATPase
MSARTFCNFFLNRALGCRTYFSQAYTGIDSARMVHDLREMNSLRGLSNEEARRKLALDGPNEVPESKPRLWRDLVGKLWAPVPWMLEITILLELLLRKRFEAAIIGALLVFNAILSFSQERRASTALRLLRQKLQVQARVLRDGRWNLIPARELVRGDFVHLRMGDLVPADLQLVSGELLLDQSALTGESLPIEAQAGASAFAGTIIRRGEADGEIIATGGRTRFGRTAELVRVASAASHLETVIFAIVKYLVIMDAVLVTILLGYSRFAGLPLADALPFALILLIASVPVALPATFTLATALGSIELARRGVLVTRLAAVEEAAAMDVLCSDKTGTITMNRLTLAAIVSYAPHNNADVLRSAAYASDEATQDPIDLEIIAQAHSASASAPMARRLKLIPFSPAAKLSEAILQTAHGTIHVLKGAPHAIAARASVPDALQADIEKLAAKGYRLIAVASGAQDAIETMGLLAFEDPPRADSSRLIASIRGLGIRVLMVTGDGLDTARTIASEVGITGRACSPRQASGSDAASLLDYDVIAGVFPEDKFNLVQSLQRAGHIVGMTGDGVNDAPALKQAEVGIAVSSATDVAKAAASVVLTNPGLTDIIAAVESSRRIYQRMLTYTLNKVIKTVEIAFFLTIGVILAHEFIITPALIVLLLFTNDFVTMSIATDRVNFSRRPDRWRVGTLIAAGFALGSLILVLSLGLFTFGRDALALPLPALHTLVFITLVYTGQGAVYLVRERSHLWRSAPSRWMLLASVCDVCVVSMLAISGILMAPIAPFVVGLVLGSSVLYLLVLDFLKVNLLRWLKYAP